MKKVVLIGDSILVCYQERVKELLSDIAEVFFTGNIGYSASVLWYIREMFKNNPAWKEADVIHWNTGLYDHYRHLDDGLPLVSEEEYLYINRRIHRQLTTYTNKQIFALTLPAGEGYTYDPDGILGIPREEWNKEVHLYNTVISAYMKHEGVMINDLYSLVESHPEYLGENGITLSEAGAEAAAQQIANCIREYLMKEDIPSDGEIAHILTEKESEELPDIDWEYLNKK